MILLSARPRKKPNYRNDYYKSLSMLKLNKMAFLFTLPIMLGGCLSLLPEPKPAPTVYRLYMPVNHATQNTNDKIFNKTVINIDYPQAAKALAGSDIVLSPDGRRLTAAAGASWAEPVPAQIRQALIDELENSKIIGVIPKGGTRVPYRLNIDIRRFEAVFDNGEDAPPLAIVKLRLSLTDNKTRSLIGSKTISTSQRADMRSVSSIVEAQGNATHSAMQEARQWLLAKIK